MRDIAELAIELSKPPPSLAAIQKVEQVIGATLPSSYIAFLTEANGGYPEICRFDFISDSGIAGGSAVNSFFHIGDDDDQYSVQWNTRMLRKDLRHARISDNVFAIGENGGGDIIFLDLATQEPAVYYNGPKNLYS